MISKTKWVLTAGLLIGVLLLASCTTQNDTQEPGGQNPSLANTSWVLKSYGDPNAPTEALPGAQVTLQFDDAGAAGGSSGCNSYGGMYKQEGSTVAFSEVVSTLMACTDAGVMDQEQRYLGALQSTAEFELSGDTLKIFYNAGQGVLSFTRAEGG